MAWRRGATSHEAEEQPAMPWRVGSTLAPRSEPLPVAVEAWDDEVPQTRRTDDVAASLRRRRAQLGPGTRHALGLALFALAVIGAIAGFLVAWMHIVNDPLADAHAYYEAARRLNLGQPLYPAGADPNGNEIYLYPPLLAIALRPLALLGFPLFAAVWEAVIVLSFVLLLRQLGVRRSNTWLAVGILGIPIGWALTVAQAHVPFTLLLALGQPWSIALAANLKLTPVLIAIWWLGRRNFEAFAAFLVWLVLLVLVQVVLDTSGSFAYFGAVGIEQIGQVRNWSPFQASPVLWAALVVVGALVALGLARTRWGWPAAVALVTFSPPRLLVYMFMGLLAAMREPRKPGEPGPADVVDAAAGYRKASR